MARFYPSGGGGGASGSDDCTATAGDLLKGTTAILSGSDDEPVQGTLELTGDAQTGDVLKNKGFYNVNAKVKSVGTLELTGNMTAGDLLAGKSGYATDPKTKINGSIVDRGTVNHSLPINGTYTIPGGKHSGSGKVTQSIPTQGALTLKPGKTAKTGSVSGKYMTGNITVPAVSIAANLIKKGSRITFPDGSYVDGTFEGYVATATDLYVRGNNIAGFEGYGNYETGAIYLNMNRAYEAIRSTKSYNLSPYSTVNAEVMYTYLDGPYARVRVYLESSTSPAVEAEKEKDLTVSLNKVSTISVNISDVNFTGTVDIGFGATDGGEYGGDKEGSLQVYRIWLA